LPFRGGGLDDIGDFPLALLRFPGYGRDLDGRPPRQEPLMTPLRQRLTQDLQRRNYSPRTVDCYVRCVAAFAQHFGHSPDHLGAEHVRAYQMHLIQRKASWSRFNQAVCALRFLYGVTLGQPDLVRMIPFGKKPKALPAVLSQDEVRRLFAAAAGLPWLLMLVQTTYACGLRAGEVLRLQVTDIDSARMVVHVRCAKGRKDRLVPLSPGLLALLRDYWKRSRPRDWLFPGRHHGKPLNPGSVQRLFRRLVLGCGLTKKASLHTLRHSYATHLLEAGCNLASLQKLLGHNQLSTTLRYTHLEQTHLQRVGSPLDSLLAASAGEGPGCLIPPWMSEPSAAASPDAARPDPAG
jgi:integrase/recombinase XerD